MNIIDQIELDAIKESLDRADDPWVNADIILALETALEQALKGEVTGFAMALCFSDGSAQGWCHVNADNQWPNVYLNTSRLLKQIEETG